MSGLTSTPEPSWSRTLWASALPGRCGLSLETADGEALLGDGVGDVGGVLPDGELDDAHDQHQQQRRGENQLGRDRAALVSRSEATRTGAGAERSWRGRAWPQRHGGRSGPGVDVVRGGRHLEAMIATTAMARATNKAVMTTVSVE